MKEGDKVIVQNHQEGDRIVTGQECTISRINITRIEVEECPGVFWQPSKFKPSITPDIDWDTN